MSEKRLYSYDRGNNKILCNLNDVCDFNVSNVFQLLNSLANENEQLKNELRKEKSLREYSDSMYGADLIVNIRFSNGEWKADVSVIEDE